MSERLRAAPESSHEKHPVSSERKAEIIQEIHEKSEQSRHEHQEQLVSIREKAEKAAERSQDVKKSFESPRDADSGKRMVINSELKKIAFQRTMKRTREKLPAYKRPLSKFIHQPIIESASEVAGKTIARPSGVLAGGIAAFIGSSLFLWIARHYGYEYNFLLFALFFVAGFFVGLVIELILRLVRRKH